MGVCSRHQLPPTPRCRGGYRASGGEAKAAALHADLQAVCRLTAGVDDATVHVTRQVTVATLLRHTAAAKTRVVPRAGAAGGTVQHDVTQSQELAEEAGQNTVNTAVCRDRQRDRQMDRESVY